MVTIESIIAYKVSFSTRCRVNFFSFFVRKRKCTGKSIRRALNEKVSNVWIIPIKSRLIEIHTKKMIDKRWRSHLFRQIELKRRLNWSDWNRNRNSDTKWQRERLRKMRRIFCVRNLSGLMKTLFILSLHTYKFVCDVAFAIVVISFFYFIISWISFCSFFWRI